jgi:hypothetical protein
MALGDGRSAFSSFWFDFSLGGQLAAGLRSDATVALFLEYEAVLTRPEHLAQKQE